ncbi:MAG: acetyltransferase [Alphaproteobacteria bacterium]|nr:acetyltransferase [Alphaproteobacteria bacterium]
MKNLNKTKKLVIFGLGETATLAYEYFTHDSEYEVAAFSVNEGYLTEKEFQGLPVVAFEKIEEYYSPEKYNAFVAIAGGQLNRQRTRVYRQMKEKGYVLASYVSSRAFVWHNVEIGENCFIFENNTLQPFTKIGNNVVMWSGNHLGHRSVIKDNCFITSHVVISGFCEIGENTYIGVNSSIADNVKVAEDNYLAMGAVVSKKTQPNSVYRGNPAQRNKIVSAKAFCGVLGETE